MELRHQHTSRSLSVLGSENHAQWFGRTSSPTRNERGARPTRWQQPQKTLRYCIKRPACARQRKHCIVTSLPFPSDTFPILAFLISFQYSYSSFCRHIGSTLHAAPAVCMDSVSPKRARCWGFPRSRSVLGFPKIDVGAGVSQDRSRESFRTLDVRCWGFPSQTSKGLECSDTGYPHAGD